MQFLRFLIFILFISVFIFLISLLLPSYVTVSRSVMINASVEKVSSQITDFEEWKNWYPAFKDENITVIKNPLKSNSVILKDKRGENTSLNLIDASKNNINIEVASSSSAKVNYQFIIMAKMNNQTLLTWNVNTGLGWLPWKRIQGIFLDKFSGIRYEAALEDLKKAAEN